MLQKQYRLPASIRLQNTKSYSLPAFTIKISPNNLNLSRLAVVVSKSIDKRAVVRNRLRRQFQRCFQSILASAKPGYDVLVLPRHNILNTPTPTICDNLNLLLRKAGLLS